MLLCIDIQNDFVEGGSLEVAGAAKDIENITKFIYNNINCISKIVCSLDTHIPQQIFHPCWWVNSNKEEPAPYTIITYEDFKKKKWEPVFGDKEETEIYLKNLEKEGKKQLCIWPYHCIWGTEGAMLENEFSKMVYFHSVVRNSICKMLEKGKDQYSEMYGIIKPEYSKNNFINKEILELVKEYDEIYVVNARYECWYFSITIIIC